MEKMIKIKAVDGSNETYHNFYCEDSRNKKQFVKDSKDSMIGFDSLRVVKSEGWK